MSLTLQELVDAQAERHDLWFPVGANGSHVDRLQKALRALHVAIEGRTQEECAMETIDALIEEPP